MENQQGAPLWFKLALATLALAPVFLLGIWFEERNAEKRYSQYEAKIHQQEADYNSLKESATRIATARDRLDEEMTQLKMVHAQRDIALAVLNAYGDDTARKVARTAVFDDYYKNLGNVSAPVLHKNLCEIVNHAETGYLERIVLHKIAPGENLTQISKRYGLPIEMIEEFNSALFNGKNNYPITWKIEPTVKGMTSVTPSDLVIQKGEYLAIPVYRKAISPPPAPPAPEAKPLPPAPPAPPAPEEVEEPK